MSHARPKFRRVVLKLSGEGLSGPGGPIDDGAIGRISQDLKSAVSEGFQVAVVVGGGNLVRGTRLEGTHRVVADQMGMLATAINGLTLQDHLENIGVPTRVLSAVPIASFCEPFIRRRCLRHLEKGRVVVLVAGTGNPFFTTDTAAALRASEIAADGLLKATQVEGVYSADPLKDPKAQRFETLSYRDVIERDLEVMDTAAVVLCKENSIPIVVFRLQEPGNLLRACRGEEVGTLVGATRGA